MEITTDVILKGTEWSNAINNLSLIFNQRTNYSIFILAISIGIKYDKRIEKNAENGEDVKYVPRNVLQNNDNGKLDFMFQAAILSTTTIDISEDERLELAFGEKGDFNRIGCRSPIDFLSQFANFGITKLNGCVGNSDIETMDNLKKYLVSVAEGQNIEIADLPEALILEE